MRLLKGLILGMAAVAVTYAQPRITAGGVTNAASYVSPDMPGGAVAKGSFFVIKGSGLGPASIQVGAFPFPTSLSGTAVKVTVGGTSVDAYMYYTSAAQVAAILPSQTPSGNGTVTVTYNGQTSATSPIRVVDSAFGVFTLNQAGSGPGVIQNANSGTDITVNTLTNSARPGQVAIIWGTGLGPVTTPNEASTLPTTGDLPVNVEVYVGGQRATVSYKGRSGCCVGLDQVVFTVPQNVEGCYVPVVVKAGELSSNFTTMAIARNGGSCSDATGLTAAQLEAAQRNNGFKTGNILLSRMAISAGGFNLTMDAGTGFFYGYNFDQVLRSRGIGAGTSGAVAPGSCLVFTYSGEEPGFEDVVEPTPLNAGPVINVNGPKGAKQMQRGQGGVYSGQFTDFMNPTQTYLDPGNYKIDNGTGGDGANAVGRFSIDLTLPQAMTWTNMAAVNTVNRSAGQTVTWTGGDPNGYVSITGGAANANGGAAFYCMERASVGTFNIPSYVLSAIPATSGEDQGFLMLTNSTKPVTFTAPGLDLGTASAAAGAQKTVEYR